MVIFLYICIMNYVDLKGRVKYLIYVLHFYDESIEENNVSGHNLSKKCAEVQEKYGSWIADISICSKEDIVENVWYKEDVDEFNKENPETISWTFIVYKDNYRWKQGEKNYYEYSPLKEQRDKKLKMIL